MKPTYTKILLLSILPILIFFHTRGAITHDEGYILHSAEKIVNGQIPYRDFHFVYTPGSIFITSWAFAILPPSILTSRLLMIAISLLSSLLIIKLITISTKNKLYATIAALIFIAWGPSHINFVWPVMLAIPAALLTMFYLLKFQQDECKRYLPLAGIALFATFLAKQNFGIAMIFPLITFFVLNKQKSIHHFLFTLYGFAWGAILFTIYLIYTKSFGPFFIDFYEFTLQRILIMGNLVTPFIYRDDILPMIFRTIFYLLVPIACLTSISLLSLRRRLHYVFLPSFVLVFYIVGIRPTTDYIHLAPLLSIIGIPLVLTLRFNVNTNLRYIMLLLAFFLILLGFHTALFKGHYRWDTPLIQNNSFVANKKAKVFLSEKLRDEFNDMIQTMDRYSNKNDYIFVNSYNPMIYFITERKEPTKNNFLKADTNPAAYYRESLGALIAIKIKVLVLTRNSISTIPINEYIKNNYFFYKTIQDFDIYIRKT